jgi:hypothetical protein
MNGIAATLAAVAMVAGCESMVQRVDCASGQYDGVTANAMFPQTPRLDCEFGKSVDMAVARQVIDKDAGAKNAARRTAGIDGIAAKEAIDRYQKSFRSPEPNTGAFTIGVTGGQSSGGAP